jgi:hypothetical protein
MRNTIKLLLSCMLFSSCVLLSSCTEEDIRAILTPSLTQEEVIRGLREALTVGTDTSVSRLNRLDGYFADQAVKILLPPEAQVIQEFVGRLPGGQSAIDDVVLRINRAAEQAAAEATPIFVNAITGITIQDGFAILRGSDTAATNYLRGNTFDSLSTRFQVPIGQALNTSIVGGISAESAYTNLVQLYNSIPRIPFIFEAPPITNSSLSAHTTRRALDGLFVKVGEEERKIRRDPLHRVSEILRKVFGS